MSDHVLEVRGLSKRFGGVRALQNVDLSIRKGEVHCLAGGNGSGKSTLIKLVSGTYTPDSGTIVLDGEEFQKLTPIDSIRKGVQVIYQDLSVFPNLTVAENIALNNEVLEGRKRVRWREMDRTATRALERIGVRLDRRELVENLSVADKQLVAIARAIVGAAKLIIMDEPTTALTRREIDALFRVIRTLQADGVAVLFVSHKLDEIFEISQRFTILRNGERIITDRAEGVDPETFVHHMTGRKIEEEPFVPAAIDTSRTLYRVDKLSLKNGFEEVSFQVHPGEILGITGLLGSGRTELAKALFGLYAPDGGAVFIDGAPALPRTPMAAVRQGVAYVPEDRLTEGLCLAQSVQRNFALSSLDAFTTRRAVDRGKIAQAFEHWRRELGIKLEDPHDPAGNLSGGNQQKVVLAKWLATQPRVLLLNGPTVGVDVGAKWDLHHYLRELVRGGEMAVVIISDDLGEVVTNCNRILVMMRGRIAEELRNTDTSEHDLLARITASA